MFYKKNWTILFCLCLLTFGLQASQPAVYIDFYSEKIKMNDHKDMVLDMRICAKNSCVKKYYEAMEETNYPALLKELADIQSRLELNDWHYYELLSNTVDKIWKSKDKMQQTMTKWFLLSKAGYETRISNAALEVVFIHIKAKGNFVGIPKHKDGPDIFINITAFDDKINTNRCWLTQTKFVAPGKGKAMKISGVQYPAIKPVIEKKTIEFSYKDQPYSLTVELDKNVKDLLRRYPKLKDEDYLEVEFSNTLKNSLIPQLRKAMTGMNEREKAAFLTAFCRTAFTYKWDFDLYDEKRPQTAEQVFASEYSDHEDRCALFYQLAKNLLDKPILVIGFLEYYMTIGVALDEPVGTPVPYEGKKYTICDPTAPANSSEIGKWPNGLTGKTAEVIKSFR